MKFLKSVWLVYLFIFIKILATYLFFTGRYSFDFTIFSIATIPMSLVWITVQEHVDLCFIVLIVDLVLWFVLIIFALFGIFFQKVRIVSIVLFMIATVIDAGMALSAADVFFKISCSSVSVIMLGFCIFCLVQNRRKKQAEVVAQ